MNPGWPAPGNRGEAQEAAERAKRYLESQVPAALEACQEFSQLEKALEQGLDLATYLDLVEPPEDEGG